jgi:hypothetical protein
MASKIDFLKRGLTAEAKSYLDEIIQSTRIEAEKAFEKAVSTKEIEKYKAKARKEEWVTGPVETICDDYWYGGIEKSIISKINQAPADTDDQVKNIPDLDNVLYVIYAELFTTLMNKKGFDDAIFHSDIESEINGVTNVDDAPEEIKP